MNTKSKQQLPKWFNGELYEEGATVRNRFSGEEYELNAMELSMYDFVMGSSIMSEMGMDAYGFAPDHRIIKNLRKGLDWFRKHNAEAYMVLLD
jgi:hypothetical protein